MFLKTDVVHYSFSEVNDLSSNPFLQLILDLKNFEVAASPTQSFKNYKMLLL